MSKHTPGPWKWDEPSNWLGLEARVFTNEPYGVVAHVPIEAWRPKQVGRDNARLIAAAPTMLEALKDIRFFVGEDFANGPDGETCASGIYRSAYKKLLAAIKLAEGEL